jgi:hypothetical protein
MKPVIKYIFCLLAVTVIPHAAAQSISIHVIVALCDNENQGIVKVQDKYGNGGDAENNLYWGCKFGIRSFFRNSPHWKLVYTMKNPDTAICERVVFRRRGENFYMVADAYRGDRIKKATEDLLTYASGAGKISIRLDSISIPAGGGSALVCYAGHNGLMDFDLQSVYSQADSKKRSVVILACSSRPFFSGYLKKTGADPLILTTGLMCPEAYTLDAIIDSWIDRDAPVNTVEKAARTYNKYQKCGMRAARKLFTSGY